MTSDRKSHKTYLTAGIDVANIGSNPRRAANIVEAQRRHERIVLEQKRQWLANSASSTENGDFAKSGGAGRESTSGGKNGTESRTSEHGGRGES